MRTAALVGALFVLLAACSNEAPDDTSSGGAGGTGGTSAATGGKGGAAGQATAGMGGASAAGGTGATGGTSGGSAGTGTGATGGSAGMGTAGTGIGTGGTPSSGGAAATGGAMNSGGMPSGGTPGSGGMPAGGGGGSAGTGTTAGMGGSGGSAGVGEMHWVGTWATGPQTTESQNLPPTSLANNTLRQFAHVSIGGSQLRVRISNAYGKSAVTIDSVHIAKAMTGGSSSAVDTASDKALAFSGMETVTIQAGKEVWSDPFDFQLAALSNVGISIAFGMQMGDVTGHPGSRTTSYIGTGNQVSAASITTGAAMTDHWYFITGIDVMAPAAAKAVAILGDSITDGRGSTTNMNDRWPDQLAKRLQANAATANIGVLNLGIGGNAVVSGGLGPTATARFDSDILGQSGVKWVMVLEGVNDIGAGAQASGLTGAFQTFIDKSHTKGLLIYGIPVLPFAGNTDYDSSAHQMVRTQVNDWIKAAGHFDKSVPLDTAVGDTSNPPKLQSAYDSGDALHLSPAGYQKMADSIDLTLFQ